MKTELFHLPGFYEPFAAISHLAGVVVFAILGGILLDRGRGNTPRMFSLGVYAVSCVLLLSLSGVYHMLPRGTSAHRVLERLDHGAIFLLIAGTFTPPHVILFRGPLRWGPLFLVWTAAITGITLKTIFFDDLPEAVGLTFYLALGWFGAVSTVFVARRYGITFIKPLLLGGVAYSVGALAEFVGGFTALPGVIHPHEMFHLTVLIGAFLHWAFIWQFAAGAPPAPRAASA